jgi:hypothetical protein
MLGWGHDGAPLGGRAGASDVQDFDDFDDGLGRSGSSDVPEGPGSSHGHPGES